MITAPTTTLYRAVGLNEAQDIEEHAGFRVNSSVGLEHGKWFATSFDDAVRWGRAMQRFPRPRPFRIAAVVVPTSLLGGLDFRSSLDTIGPAYFARQDQMARLVRSGRIIVSDEIHAAEQHR